MFYYTYYLKKVSYEIFTITRMTGSDHRNIKTQGITTRETSFTKLNDFY